MPDLEHLQLIRLEPLPERRKRPGFGVSPSREYGSHGQKIQNETEAVLAEHQQLPQRAEVNPALILKVQLDGNVTDDEWERAGLTVLADDPDKTLILFATDEELTTFRERVERYSGGPQGNQQNPPYASFVASIESVSTVGPEDRLGSAARAEGFRSPDDINPETIYAFDVALWDLGNRDRINSVVAYIEQLAQEAGGAVPDRYLGTSLILLRIRGSGSLIRQVLELQEVAEVDLPPKVDAEIEELLEVESEGLELGNLNADDEPAIAIVDSGITDHPLLSEVTLAARGFPESLQTSDVLGHGTKVAGVAVYGNLRNALETREFTPKTRLVSAKVVNDQGQFPDDKLVVNQMRDCILSLHNEFGTRIFNVSLADKTRVFDGAKPSAWAAAFDELIRELDILIIVSAGNRKPPAPNGEAERAVIDYPSYLFDESNRLFEPASSALAIAVGAIANGNGLPGGHFDAINVRPITEQGHPSPFSRIGFGVKGAIKPDFSDFGGTNVYDGVARAIKGGEQFASAGVVLPDHQYLQRLFTAGSGTSYAAPLVAFKAAQVLKAFPDASANLLRALLANSANIPSSSAKLMKGIGDEACYQVLGYGVVDPQKAIASDDNRVVLYAEETISIDHFAVFEVPIPEEFQTERGERWIRATLAFDPPVRHTRLDYLGITMSLRLVRGWSEEDVFEHFRRRNVVKEGRHPDLPNANDCCLLPKKRRRDAGTLQSGLFKMQREVSRYGDTYYLVVRAEGGWAANLVARQDFAVVVEIGHKAEIPLYTRIRERVAARVRAKV